MLQYPEALIGWRTWLRAELALWLAAWARASASCVFALMLVLVWAALVVFTAAGLTSDRELNHSKHTQSHNRSDIYEMFWRSRTCSELVCVCWELVRDPRLCTPAVGRLFWSDPSLKSPRGSWEPDSILPDRPSSHPESGDTNTSSQHECLCLVYSHLVIY